MTRVAERTFLPPQPPKGLPASLIGKGGARARAAALSLLAVIGLALVGLVVAMQRPAAMTLSTANVAFDHASVGWNASERRSDGTAFRWTKDESTLTFRVARQALPANRRLILTMRFSTRPPGAPLTTVTLLANGATLDSWPSNVDHPVVADVTALLRTDDELHLIVRVNQPYAPAGEPRQLGIPLVGDAQLAASPGIALPSPDAALSVIVLVALAALAVGRRAVFRRRIVAAGAMACVVTLGVLVARVPFWRIAMPLEVVLGLLVIALWTREWWTALVWPIRALQTRTHLGARVLIVGGGGVALVGEIIVAQHRWMSFGSLVLAVGLVLLLAGLIPTPPTPLPPREGGGDGGAHRVPFGQDAPADREAIDPRPLAADEMRIRTWQVAVLVGVAALAVALRFTLLTQMPASLFKDEARHAIMAAHILDDSTYRPVYEPLISLPALFLYPMALAFKLFGVSVTTLRFFMATVGVVDVLLFFFLSRRLFGTRLALIAVYFFAVAFWALRLQRVALAPCFSTGLVLLGMFLFVRAMQERRWWDWALAGVGAAGAIYCYESGPFAVIFMALVALVLLIREPRRFLRYWLPRFALQGVIFLILAAPLLRYIALHFDQYTFRPHQTAIFSEENLSQNGQDQLAALEDTMSPNLGMYTVQGDFEPKHNLPNAPHFDAIMAVLLLAGAALALSGRLHGPPHTARRFGEWLALGYLATMLIPSILAIDAPNTLRAFDTLPPALLLAALGAEAVWVRLTAPTPDPSPAQRERGDRKAISSRPPLPFTGEGSGVGVAFVTLAAILALNAGTYFGVMRNDPRETYRFDTYFQTQAGQRMAAEARARPGMAFFVPKETIDRDVLPFFARVIAGSGTLAPIENVNAATLPAHYAILLPNGKSDKRPDDVIHTLPWAQSLERVPGNSPAGAGGVPAFIEYRTPM